MGAVAGGLARLLLSASLARSVPVSPDMEAGPIHVEGREGPQSVEFNYVGPGYLRTKRIPLLRGRGSVLLTRRGRGGQADPLFRSDAPPRVIVGVAKDISYHEVQSKMLRSVASGAYVYLPVFQAYRGRLSVLLRTGDVNSVALISPLRREIRELDPALPVFDLMTLEDRLNTALSQEQGATALLSIFGLLALALAAVGLYGVVACAVAQF